MLDLFGTPVREDVEILVGDCRDVLRGLPAGSVHCCVTSPPYFGLRDYGNVEQIGLEQTPDDYVRELVGVFREIRRVLRDDGTLWLNLGDSYAASQSNNGGYSAKNTLAGFTNPNTKGRQANESGTRRKLDHGVKPKDLIGIPWRVAFALQADGWYLRSDIIWHKPNPMPESVTDRPTSAHEHVFLLAKSPKYYFDAAAVKEPATNGEKFHGAYAAGGRVQETNGRDREGNTTATRNIRNVWTITPKPFRGAHFATFPPALVEPCVKAGTSEAGCCSACGAPQRRVLGERVDTGGRGAGNGFKRDHRISVDGRGDETVWTPKSRDTVGFEPTCSCATGVVPCTVLDPFGGSGTVGMVARQLGRHAVLVELNPDYAAMARERVYGSGAPHSASMATTTSTTTPSV